MERSMSVTAQVDMALDDVIEVLSDDGLGPLILEALDGVLARSSLSLVVRAEPPQRISVRTARLSVMWWRVDGLGAATDGQAFVQLFALRSGSAPLTELNVTLTVDDSRARPIAEALHRLLDELTTRLAV
jgi:hypothetical protein